jgi:hypothetical protein
MRPPRSSANIHHTADTVISAFPRRWGRNKPDPSAVHRGIRDRLAQLDSDEIHSVYDLALVVVDECSKVFFDQTKALDQRPEVVDLFSSAISKIVSLCPQDDTVLSQANSALSSLRRRTKQSHMRALDVISAGPA